MIVYCFILGLLMKVHGTPLGAPEYLSIEGHEDCLGTVDKGSFEASCLPSTRPDICIPPAWDLLQDAWDGENCLDEPPIIGGIGGLPPAYLEVPDFDKCLSTQDSQLCLPSTRPSNCPRRSWFELLEKFDGDCPPPITVIGGIGGLPPAYLSIPGYEDCLQTVNQGGSNQLCFPVSKPGACIDASWEELLDKFEGDDCPERPIVG